MQKAYTNYKIKTVKKGEEIYFFTIPIFIGFR